MDSRDEVVAAQYEVVGLEEIGGGVLSEDQDVADPQDRKKLTKMVKCVASWKNIWTNE